MFKPILYWPFYACLLLPLTYSDVVSDYLDSDEIYAGRSLQHLQGFPQDLSGGQLDVCLAFLRQRQAGENFRYDIVRQNDLADWLLQNGDYADATTSVLLSVIKDEAQQMLWREYAVQKLGLAYCQKSVSELSRSQIIETLFVYVEDQRKTLAGTALLGLYRIYRDAPISASPVEAELVVEASRLLLDNPKCSVVNRVTALQVAASLGDERSVALARNYVQDDEAPLSLRSAAISALAKFATPEDRQYITSLTKHPDYRIRKAAEAALKISQ